MTMTDLVRSLATDCNLTQDQARTIITTLFDTIEHAVACGDQVRITGHGTYKSLQRSPRVSRNIKTGEPIHTPAKTVPAFTPATAYKDRVNRAAQGDAFVKTAW